MVFYHNVAVSLFMIIAASAAQAQPSTAEKTVVSIYRELPQLHFDYHKVLYAPRLKRLLAREAADATGEVGLIDAVPFCDCQDTGEDYGFTTSSRSISAGRVEVMVHLRNGGRSLYHIDMVRLPNGWAVQDVHGPVHRSLARWLRANLH